ncbi:hypothetical protein MCP1_290023 [Candidatus Terasakiella magnetica]|nr:hypothetical protein MCP1_290023 [Candidatus Terasakiella magnetica]
MLLTAATSPVSASGQRSTVLTESQIESFGQLTPEEFAKQSLSYAGSTSKWHVFMRVDTFSGGGMPMDRLSSYKVDVGDVTIVDGWTLRFSGQEIRPQNCPQVQPIVGEPRKWLVSGHASVRERCGT